MQTTETQTADGDSQTIVAVFLDGDSQTELIHSQEEELQTYFETSTVDCQTDDETADLTSLDIQVLAELQITPVGS